MVPINIYHPYSPVVPIMASRSHIIYTPYESSDFQPLNSDLTGFWTSNIVGKGTTDDHTTVTKPQPQPRAIFINK